MIPEHTVIYEHVIRPEWCSLPLLIALALASVICLLGLALSLVKTRWLFIIPCTLLVIVLLTATFYMALKYVNAQADANAIASMLRKKGVTLQEEPDGRYSLNWVVVRNVAGERMEFPYKGYVSRVHWERLVKYVRNNPQYQPLPKLVTDPSIEQNN